MRRKLFFFFCIGSLGLAWEAHASSCSCTAPDRSCTASITCSGGCSAICGSGGNCSSSGESAVQQEKRNNLVSLSIEAGSAQEISATLTELSGVPVVWVPRQADSTVSMQVQDYPMEALLAGLAKRGAVAVGGRSPETRPSSKAFDPSRVVTVQAFGADAATLSSLLGEILQGPVELTARDPRLTVNLDLKEMPVSAVVRQLSRFGELTLDGEPLNR
jgi:hypothetical protein